MRPFTNLVATARRRPWRSLLLLTFALIVLGFAGAFAARYFSARSYLSAAEQAIRRYDFAAARQHLHHAFERRPNDERVQLLAAQVARRLDDYADAEQLVTAAEQAHGDGPDSQREWLLLTVQQGDLSGERDFQALIDPRRPDAALLREALAKGYLNTARWRDALRVVDQMLQSEPNNVAALVLRGKGLEGLRHPEMAPEFYQRAVELAPHATWARLCLADVLGRLGHTREAIDHYERLRQRLPTDAAVLLGLARCRYDNAEMDEARDLLDRLRAAHPDHLSGLVESGRLALQQRRLTEAELFLARATTLAPWHREAQRYLGLCLEAQGKSEAARLCQARVREQEAQDIEKGRLAVRFNVALHDPAAHTDLARWLLHNGEDETGRRLLLGILEFYPHHRPAHAALADYFARVAQPRRAEHHRQLAKGADP